MTSILNMKLNLHISDSVIMSFVKIDVMAGLLYWTESNSVFLCKI